MHLHLLLIFLYFSSSLSCQTFISNYSFCSDVVTWLVPSEIVNITELDIYAFEDSSNNPCSFYNNKEYQCHKYFPHCSTTIQYLCTSLCYLAKREVDCKYFSDYYFDNECTDKRYYSDVDCIIFGNFFDKTNSVLLIIGYVALGITVAFLLWYLYFRIYKQRYIFEKSAYQDNNTTNT